MATCRKCDKPVGVTRIVIEGWWWCPSCVYLREHPEAATTDSGPFLPPVRKEKPKPPPEPKRHAA
jgi:hypothetical protein